MLPISPSSENLRLSPMDTNLIPRRAPPPPPPSLQNSTKSSLRSKTFSSGSSTDLIKFDSSDLKNRHEVLEKVTSFTSYISGVVPQDNSTVKRIGASSFMNYGREELMKHCMAKKQDDYTIRTPFRIFIGTWNVNGQYPTEPLDKWLQWEDQPPDIYVIGFQELDLSKEAFVFADSAREETWLNAVRNSLHPKEKYVFVKLVRLVGMMVLMFTQAKHSVHIRNVVSHQVGTGLLGKMGNKGGVAIRFDLHGSTFCAVNSHLAAHAEETQRRNQDFRDICQRMKFENDKDISQPLSIFEHDILFWFGDLNYRIEKLDVEDVKQSIELQNYKLLREYDQLHRERSKQNVFENFEEGEIYFRPTYKYDPGSDNWDTGEKFRTPAWCDRILWQEPNQEENSMQAVTQLSYQSHSALKISDHKPVSSTFCVSVKVIDTEKYRKIYEDEIRNLDRMENDHLPAIKLSEQQIEFGLVKFQQTSLQSINLSNIGQSPCHFEFICKPGENCFCKPWLTISKPKGFLLPGVNMTIEFEIYVNKNSSPALNNMSDKIEDILILHLQGGKDFFITLNGTYTPSCFGCSIETLCRCKLPIQFIERTEIARLSNITPLMEESGNDVMQIPKELFTLIDHLFECAIYQPNLFQQPGLHEEVLFIMETLDSKMPLKDSLSSVSNHSVAEALLIFLEALPEPVIPFAYYTPFVNSYSVTDTHQCVELVKTMSPLHLNVFNYVMSFLHEILECQKENGVIVDLLSSVFSAVMIRPSIENKMGMDHRTNRMRITSIFKRLLLGT